MQLSRTTLAVFAAAATSASAFSVSRPIVRTNSVAMSSTVDEIAEQLNYKPGKANSEFARRFGHLAGSEVKTVGEAFAEFNTELGHTVNALYKNMVTDLVGVTHLNVVNARFERDPIWCLGLITVTELLLKNYPEKEIGEKIVSSLFKCISMDEEEVRAEAAKVAEWTQGKSKADIEAVFESPDESDLVGSIAKKIKDDKYWLYSRYFGLGLVKMMEIAGVEMEKDEVYPIMEDWMSKKLGASHLSACNDSDMYFKVRGKLEMMETMMKEIEIREKKRMAERLEEKAEAALRAAEREDKFQQEVENEKKEPVESS